MNQLNKQINLNKNRVATSFQTPPVTEFLLNDRQSLYDSVANRIASLLTRGIEKRGRASFIVPGGSTPAPVFEKLSNLSLLWHNVLVAPSDERWVSVEHEQSNQNLIQRSLLINHAAKAQIMSLKNTAETASEGELAAAKSISVLPQPYDVVMLGMGNDGHFASLFPNSKPIAAAMDPESDKKCIAIDASGCPVAGEYPHRMSLTLSAILDSQLIILLVTGKEKLAVLRQAAQENDPLSKPVAALLTQRKTPLEIYWAE